MTANIASKNLFDLLGNDPELDPDREPEPPTQAIDKPVQRSGKRNEGPARDNVRAPAGGRGGRQDGEAPATNPREEGFRPDRMREPRGDRGDRRGGRGGRGGRGRGEGGRGEHRGNRSNRDDRGDHSGQKEHEKQAAHGWGAATGQGEYDDEKAGDVIAQAEAKNDAGFTPDVGSGDPAFTNGPTAPTAAEDVAPAEPEDNTKSYEEYLADLAEKRKALSNNTTEIRKANEGSKQKFPEGTAFQRNPENEMFFAGSGGKTKKQKEVKEKERVELDGQYYAPVAQEGGRGGRGGRGGSFRGGDRGDRGGRGGDRGDRGDRGERRGGRGRGDSRGGARGDRGGDRSDRGGAPRGGARGVFNAQDESAFPALGGN